MDNGLTPQQLADQVEAMDAARAYALAQPPYLLRYDAVFFYAESFPKALRDAADLIDAVVADDKRCEPTSIEVLSDEGPGCHTVELRFSVPGLVRDRWLTQARLDRLIRNAQDRRAT
jgi:hypothetical protein